MHMHHKRSTIYALFQFRDSILQAVSEGAGCCIHQGRPGLAAEDPEQRAESGE